MDVLKLDKEVSGDVQQAEKEAVPVNSAAAAVEAMKAAQNNTAASAGKAAEATEETAAVKEPTDYVKTDDKWKSMLADLQKEVEGQLKKANDTVTELLETEKKKAADAVEKELTDKLEKLEKEKNAEIERLTKENDELKKGFEAKKDEVRAEVEKEAAEKHDAELASLKAQYEQQIDTVQNANHDKLQAMRKEMDGYKEQIETLMLHIDDPFVLQEIQSGKQAGAEASDNKEAE